VQLNSKDWLTLTFDCLSIWFRAWTAANGSTIILRNCPEFGSTYCCICLYHSVSAAFCARNFDRLAANVAALYWSFSAIMSEVMDMVVVYKGETKHTTSESDTSTEIPEHHDT
jgi:hypothetical protein